jgi:hypothetical protein
MWAQQAYIKAGNTGEEDLFGHTVALSADGNILAAGAYLEDSAAVGINRDDSDNDRIDAGAVYVFVREEGIWRQQAYTKANNTDEGDQFGYSVSLSGDGGTLAVGAPFESGGTTGINQDAANNDMENSGAVYLY